MAQPTSLGQMAWWSNPYLTHGHIMERQSGYNPELSSCGMGTTCDSACGSGFLSCNANTNLALFCYDPSHGQTCCNNGDGQACDASYYCARDPSGITWCCENQYNLAQCASMYQLSTLLTSPPSSSTVSSTSSSTPDPSQPSPTSPDPILSSTTSAAAIIQHNISATTSTIGYLNSTSSSTHSPLLFTGAAPLSIVSLKRVAVIRIIVYLVLGF